MKDPRAVARSSFIACLVFGLLAIPLAPAAVDEPPRQVVAASDPVIHPASRVSSGSFLSLPKLNWLQNAPRQEPLPGDVVISEIRFRGSGGEPDEFVELFNRSCSNIKLNGWALRVSNEAGGTADLYSFPASSPDITLEPGQYYLIASAAYDSTPPVLADATSVGTVVDSGGVALFLPDGITIVDRVGLSNDTVYKEGTPLTSLTTDVDRGYRRNQAPSSMYLDTDNNAADFSLIDPSDPQNATGSGTCGIPTPIPTVTETFTATNTATDTATNTASGPPAATLTETNTATGTATRSPTATSPADCNLTPTPSVYGPRAVLINEVAWSGTLATAADEWIELHNPNSLCPVNLDEWSLVGVRAASVTQFSIPFENTDVIPAGGYFLIAAKDDIFSANAAIDKLADGPGLELLTLIDTGLILYLLGPSSEQVDTANFAAGVVNSWPAGGLSTGRYSMERYRNLPDTRTNWITYAGPTLSTSSTPKDRNGNVIRGTPGKVNWAFGVTITPSPVPTKGRTPTSPPPTPFAHMVINEFLPRAGTDWNRDGAINVFDEYIELKNLGPIDIDLKGWKLDDDPNLGSAAYTLPSLKLKPGERTVYYGSKTGILLEDSGDNVRLINLRGVVIDARTYGPVSYPDQTHCRIPDGYYWRRPCFPTPGIENSLTGEALVPAPTTTGRRAPCLLPDIVPAPFLQAECSPFGEEMWDRKYWDVLAGQSRFWVQDAFSKWKTIVE